MNKLPLPQQNQIANLNNNIKELSEPEILTGYVNNNEVQSNIHNYLFNRNGDAVQNLINLINDYTKNTKNLVPVDLFSQNIPHLYYQFDDPIERLDTWQCISDRHGNVYQLTRGWIKNNKAYSVNSVELFENASFSKIKKYINDKVRPAPVGNGDFGYNNFAKKMINSGLQFKLLSKAQGHLWHKVSANFDKYIPVRGLINLVTDQMLEQEMFLPMFNDLQSLEISWEIGKVRARHQRLSDHEWFTASHHHVIDPVVTEHRYCTINLPLQNKKHGRIGKIPCSNPYAYFFYIATQCDKNPIAPLSIYFDQIRQGFYFDFLGITERFYPEVMASKINHIKIINTEQGTKHYD